MFPNNKKYNQPLVMAKKTTSLLIFFIFCLSKKILIKNKKIKNGNLILAKQKIIQCKKIELRGGEEGNAILIILFVVSV